jgi:hypothetical protein
MWYLEQGLVPDAKTPSYVHSWKARKRHRPSRRVSEHKLHISCVELCRLRTRENIIFEYIEGFDKYMYSYL